MTFGIAPCGSLLRVGIGPGIIGNSPCYPEDVDGRRACREALPYGRRARLELHVVGRRRWVEVDKFDRRPARNDYVVVRIGSGSAEKLTDAVHIVDEHRAFPARYADVVIHFDTGVEIIGGDG